MTGRDRAATAAPAAERALFRKLRPGPGLSREVVAMDQKLRLRVALSGLAAEAGYEAVTVRAVLTRAEVSSSTFYKHHDGIESCLAEIVGMTIGSVVADLRQGDGPGGDAIEGLRTAVGLLMERMARDPQTAQTVFVESYAAGPRILDEMDSALGELEGLLARILALAPRPAIGTTHLAVGLVAGAVAIIRRTTLTGRANELPSLAGELVDWMLSVAHEEIVTFCVPGSRPTDGIDGGRPPSTADPSASRESVSDAGRRAMTTTARLAATDGLPGLTSARIRKDAGLSRREFERHFVGVEACFLDAIESLATRAADASRPPAEDAGSWERWIYRTMATLCSLATREPDLARLVLHDITAPGRAGLLRREELIARAAAQIRGRGPGGRRPSELAATASISAIWRIAETEVAARRVALLPRIAPVLAYMVLASRRPGSRSGRAQAAEMAFPADATAAIPTAVPAVGSARA